MAEMLNVSRLSNAMRATALMRRAVRESVDHTRVRHVFGKPLFEQPLMRTTLLPMIIDTEGALALVLEAAARLTAADEEAARGEEGVARELVRVLTPLAKHTLCKRARSVTGEAMEIRGGNGYIEDWVNPRLLRDAHLGSIWEGSSNVIALDVLRCMRRQAAHRTLADTYGDRAETRERWERLRKKGDALLELPADEQEMRIGRYADELTRAVMETLLYDQAAHEAKTTGNGRALLVARTCTALLDDPDTPPRAALDHLAELAEGGRVEPTPAQETPAKENTVKEPAAHA
jgi:hypothetical protein